MSKTQQPELKNRQFWEWMESNAREVEKMPAWMRGTPVNRLDYKQPEAPAITQELETEPNR